MYFPRPLTLDDSLLEGVSSVDSAIVAFMLDQGASPNALLHIRSGHDAAVSSYVTALQLACMRAAYEKNKDNQVLLQTIAQLLLAAGASVDIPAGCNYGAPLWYAVSGGSCTLVRGLLACGADPTPHWLLKKAIGSGRENLLMVLDLVRFFRKRLRKLGLSEEEIDEETCRWVNAAEGVFPVIDDHKLTINLVRLHTLCVGMGATYAVCADRDGEVRQSDYFTDLWRVLAKYAVSDEELLTQLSYMTLHEQKVLSTIARVLSDQWDIASLCIPEDVGDNNEIIENIFYLCESWCSPLSERIGFLFKIPVFMTRQLPPPPVKPGRNGELYFFSLGFELAGGVSRSADIILDKEGK